MEFEESTAEYAKSLIDAAYAHPVYVLTGALLNFILLISLYCRFTLGVCKCDTDMTGKTVIITGANSGIGKETAKELAKKGARVILACRSKERGLKALEDIRKSTGSNNVVLKLLDLCSFASVRAFADEILKSEERLDVLINNAGVLGITSRVLTEDGCEKTMQSNHLSHFLLTILLLDLLKKSSPSRIINVSSSTHMFAKLRLRDINGSHTTYHHFVAYCNSKVANILFTKELAKKLANTGVTVNSVHPGVVKTEIIRGKAYSMHAIITKIIFLIVGKTPLEGAQTTIHVAVSSELLKVSGKYFADCKQKKTSKWAEDDSRTTKLWHNSEALVGLTSKEKLQ